MLNCVGRSLRGSAILLVSAPAFGLDLDMREGVTEMSQRIHTIHTISLWICIVIGIIVFGAMAYTIYAHRRSKHPE
ncbi:uncharacterized protein METZ01_LOCUS222653, partial [marine metagenome]